MNGSCRNPVTRHVDDHIDKRIRAVSRMVDVHIAAVESDL